MSEKDGSDINVGSIEEKKAIKYLKGIIEINNIKIKNIEEKGDTSLMGLGTMHDVYKLQNLNYIIVLNLIEKQDKMIDYMADRITELIEKVYDSKYNKKDVIDIFKNLAVNNLLKEDK